MASTVSVVTGIVVFLTTLRIILRFTVLKFKSDVKLVGKVVIVTGANTGIGYHVAMDLTRRGARVILACRSEGRGVEARVQIASATGNNDVVYRNLDLGSLTSVRAFCDQILATEQRLDILVNNAGVFGFGDRYTADGIVEGMQINHYGPFLLTQLLLPLLKKTTSSRIVVVTSLLHYIGTINLDYMNKIGAYMSILTYSNSKLCNIAYTIDLAERLEGCGVTVNAVHPGTIRTHIAENVSKADLGNFLTYVLFHLVCCVCYRSVEEGATGVLQACLDPVLDGVSGKFLVDGSQWPPSWRCSNGTLRKKLWEASESFVSGKVSPSK